ncbi:Structural maintenance of chromosomes protein 2 [Blastocladiella emersonii ATCC 22665]|nr:Structural maintenance of chromosomes protein 2 [Blastocladiella emersonii ATCC 22665]
MYIKEVVLEGFKSYAARTIISGWDPQFNAVTGLNGSGKSNILDAICFVLGITTLSHVRATNLQDLVYKRGQAGIQKASVSIIFDNADKDASPVGYAQFDEIVVTRQVVVGGKNKYLVNGHTTQQHVIQNLFQSVQLNVNNPHFLIMQGKITKVLNMKPMEILAMVEEAAGTRMFEERKDKAIKTIAKKEKKLEEIQTLLREEIIPKLDRLRSERAAYLDFQQTAQETERLERHVVVLEYAKLNRILDTSAATADRHRAELDRLDHQHAVLEETRAELERKERHILDSLASPQVKELERNEADLRRELAKVDTQHSLKARTVEEEQAALDAHIGSRRTIAQSILDADERHAAAARDVDRLTLLHADKSREVDRIQDTLVALDRAGESGAAASAAAQLALQLAEERAVLATLKDDMDILAARGTALDREIAALEPEVAREHESSDRVARDAEQLQVEVARLEARVAELDAARPDERVDDLRAADRQHRDRLNELAAERDSLMSRLAHVVNFQYRDPRPNFDRAQVRGTVASLVGIDKENYEKSAALEMAAGGRLHNVVVDTEVVGSQLLKNGGLRKRVTLIPLNKIQGHRVGQDKVARARQVSRNKAELALSLIRYDPSLLPAMEYVFGSTFICEDANAANQVTFNAAIRTRSVTWAGDVYDPSGVLSGGSKPQSSGLLVMLMRLREVEDEMHALEQALDTVTGELRVIDGKARALREAAGELDDRRRRLAVAQQRADSAALAGSQSDEASLANQLRTAQRERANVEARLADARDREKRTRAKVAELEREERDMTQDTGAQKSTFKKKLAAAKREQAAAARDLAAAKVAVENAAMEAAQLREDAATAAAQLDELRAAVAAATEDATRAAALVATTRNEHAAAARELQVVKKNMSKFDAERQDLARRTAQVSKDLAVCEGEQQRARAEVAKVEKDVARANESVRRLLATHAWLEAAAPGGGAAGDGVAASQSQPAMTLAEAQARLAELKKRYAQLKRNVNVNVMEMIGVAEKREGELKTKLATVLRDKEKIEETITKLDDIKEDELRKTWAKVNEDFGKIFSELLPGGNSATLTPVDADRILSGLEIRVRLGNLWKESLMELSGGQRSLIALALVLALLQFKPAPMYILDEVDAALDLSHTQNIGHLIKSRFTNSQFIIVSLKEGMFSNAHVIFKTRFRDGTSSVDRIKGPPAGGHGRAGAAGAAGAAARR